jgi:hypothetical protein
MAARQPQRKRAPKVNRANEASRLPQPPDHFESLDKRRLGQTPKSKQSPSKSVPDTGFEPFRFPG